MNMISVSKALGILSQSRFELGVEMINLTEAAGTVLAEDLAAKVTLPPFPVSAMDGYAVKISDIEHGALKFKVIGVSAAGNPFKDVLKSNEAVRIYTGGIVPIGADHIVIQENVIREKNQITISENEIFPRHIRNKGIDFFQGEVLIKKGTRLDAMHIGLAAAANFNLLKTYKKPTIAIISNGDELKEPGSKLTPGDIINSNSHCLTALLNKWNANVVNVGIAKDNIPDIMNKIKNINDADIIVPIGGASVGDLDFMRIAFEKSGFLSVFEKVAVRPGKPVWFGKMNDKLVLGLPGNPASAIVCAHIFLKTLITQNNHPPFLKAKLNEEIPKNSNRETYLRGFAKFNAIGQLEVTPMPKQDSSLLMPFVKSNVLIRLKPDEKLRKKHELVDVLPLETGPSLHE